MLNYEVGMAYGPLHDSGHLSSESCLSRLWFSGTTLLSIVCSGIGIVHMSREKYGLFNAQALESQLVSGGLLLMYSGLVVLRFRVVRRPFEVQSCIVQFTLELLYCLSTVLLVSLAGGLAYTAIQ
jgi:hypothetical protein